jgi:hypothetical protein
MPNTKILPPAKVGCLGSFLGFLCGASLFIALGALILPTFSRLVDRSEGFPHSPSSEDGISQAIQGFVVVIFISVSAISFVILKTLRPYRCGRCGSSVSRRSKICKTCNLLFEEL